MRALDQWKQIERSLDPDWDVVDLSFVPEDEDGLSRAAAVLGPLGPGRYGRELRLHVDRHGGSLERLENILGRLDGKRVWGELRLVDARVERQAEPPPAAEPARAPRRSLVEQWDEQVRKLPPGWRDLFVQLDLDSTDFVAQAALAGAPLNPNRVPGEIALRFRVVGKGLGGYGVSQGMARRCLERMDSAEITGEVKLLDALEDVDYVYTQGPVLRVGERSV
jgi:hypothetical protein